MQKIKLLVLVEKYLESSYDGLTFVHSRLISYDKSQFEIKVISFAAKEDYVSDEISVLTKNSLNKDLISDQDFVISHAPNLRNHFYYLAIYFASIKRIAFFFHGHEVLITNNFYPKPYTFYSQNRFKQILRNIYDHLKVFLLKKIFVSWLKRKPISFVFVSGWMHDVFVDNLNFSPPKSLTHIIPNPVHTIFFENSYDFTSPKNNDFICIRPLDQSKYAVDLLLEIARTNPDKNFHIYGMGTLFNFVQKPENVIHHNRYLKHAEMPEVLNKYKAAIMLTRLDAQGVMMCEMANFGIPLITSDLPICREMLSEFPNVLFIRNDKVKEIDFSTFFKTIKNTVKKSSRFEKQNSINKEEEIFIKGIGTNY